MKDCDIAQSVKEEIMQKVLAGVPRERILAGEAQAYIVHIIIGEVAAIIVRIPS